MAEAAPLAPQAPAVTWAEFLALPDDDRRELIDGCLVEVEMPTDLHEHIVAWIVGHLFNWVRANGGRVFASGYKVKIREDRGVMPDVQLYRRENTARGEQAMAEGRPDLAVEVVSKGSPRYDRVTKLQWYAGIGVPEYWIVDPEARIFQRLVLRDGLYTIAESLAEEQVLRPGSFAGLEIPLRELWVLPQ
jgi:Uma2 family endonuclease